MCRWHGEGAIAGANGRNWRRLQCFTPCMAAASCLFLPPRSSLPRAGRGGRTGEDRRRVLDLAGRVVQMRGEADVARAKSGVDAGVGRALADRLVIPGVSTADDDDRRPLTGAGGADEAVAAVVEPPISCSTSAWSLPSTGACDSEPAWAWQMAA